MQAPSSICHALITHPMRLLIVSRNKKTEMLINSTLVDKGLQGTSKDAYPTGVEGSDVCGTAEMYWHDRQADGICFLV